MKNAMDHSRVGHRVKMDVDNRLAIASALL